MKEEYLELIKFINYEIESLPVFYSSIQFVKESEKYNYFTSSTIYTTSSLHQTKQLVSKRFYKHITLFEY